MSELSGGQGPTKQPGPRTTSLYVTGAKRPGSRVPLHPVLLWTNGSITFADPEETRTSAKLGVATIPVIPVLRTYAKYEGDTVRKDENYDIMIRNFFDDTYNDLPFQESPNIHKCWRQWRVMTGPDALPVISRQRNRKLFSKILDQYDGHGFFIFETRENTVLAITEFELKEMFMRIQAWIADCLAYTKVPQTAMRLLGMAAVDQHLMSAVRFASNEFEYGSGMFKGQIWVSETKNQVKNQGYYYFMLRMLAQVLSHMIPIQHYTMYDYMALSWQIVYQESGTGENKMPDSFDSKPDALFERILPKLFNDSNSAYNYEIQNSEQLMHYFIFHIVKAIVCDAIKAETTDVMLRLTSGKDRQAVGMLKLISEADYPQLGSNDKIWWPTPRSAPRNDLFLPCLLRNVRDGRAGTNVMTRVTPVIGDAFTTTSIEHMEVKSEVFAPMELKEQWILYDLSSNDARVETVQFKRETLIMFRLRFHGLTVNFGDALNSSTNNLYYLCALYCGARSFNKKGYLIDTVPEFVLQPTLIDVLKSIPVFSGTLSAAPGETVPTETHAAQSTQPLPPPSTEVTIKPGFAPSNPAAKSDQGP